jgi:hypothetical protein
LRVSREAMLALFLLFNYLIYFVGRLALGDSLRPTFEFLSASLLDCVFVGLALFLIFKNLKVIGRAGALRALVLCRLALLVLMLAEYAYWFFLAEGIQVVQHPLYIWLLVLLAFDWFLFKTMLCEEGKLQRLMKLAGVPDWKEFFWLPLLVSVLGVVVVGILHSGKLAQGQLLFVLMPVLVVALLLSFLTTLRFYLLPALAFLAEHQVKFTGHKFWKVVGQLKRLCFLVESIDLVGHVRLKNLEILDGRAELSAVRALVLRFAEHFKGEFGDALVRALPEVSTRRLPALANVEVIPGQGAAATCDQQALVLGSEEFLVSRGIPLQSSDLGMHQAGYFDLYLSVNRQVIARLRFAERMILDGAELISGFKQKGISSTSYCLYRNEELESAFKSINGLDLKFVDSRLQAMSQINSDLVSGNRSTLVITQAAVARLTSDSQDVACLRIFDTVEQRDSAAEFEIRRCDLSELGCSLRRYRMALRVRRFALLLGILAAILLLAAIYWPVPADVSPFFWILLLVIATTAANWVVWYQSKLSIVRS